MELVYQTVAYVHVCVTPLWSVCVSGHLYSDAPRLAVRSGLHSLRGKLRRLVPYISCLKYYTSSRSNEPNLFYTMFPSYFSQVNTYIYAHHLAVVNGMSLSPCPIVSNEMLVKTITCRKCFPALDIIPTIQR